nr:MAG TPA: hypothetical protein [Caudoviricetes sp.]
MSIFTATQKNWHVSSWHLESDMFPIPGISVPILHITLLKNQNVWIQLFLYIRK